MIYSLFYLDQIILQYLLHQVKGRDPPVKEGILSSVEGFMGTVVNRELSSLHESHLKIRLQSLLLSQLKLREKYIASCFYMTLRYIL